MPSLHAEQIVHAEYAEIMQKSYIDYAMSVIIARALPDVRDGLKPVQRRTLYDMMELGIAYDKPYRKCARIVGDTMGKYHPHGDSSIYEALVVMAQDFKKGAVLVDGHGNFGSVEGDGAAAMRYTEARLSRLSQEVFLADLDKNVIDFMPNFDETEKEPVVLPARIPNILVNGAEGIAVGMATNIPPHNLGEVIDCVAAYLKDNHISTGRLMQHLPGPDFPTGGIVANKDDLFSVYETGQGHIKLRGKIELEKGKHGKSRLVITEIPYTMIGSGIGKFLNDVATLVENKITTDILDISNQSSKDGIRIVLDIKRDADVENLKNLLYKKTRLEDTFGVHMLMVADGKPQTLGLKGIIEQHVDFRMEVCTRKHTALLAREREKKEIQEGLIKACDVMDLIIEILRGSGSVAEAKACLTEGITDPITFKSSVSQKMAAMLRFTPRQAQAILDMRLVKLIGLEVAALKKEHEETLANIARYEDILNNYDSMVQVILEDLAAIKAAYAVPRRTVLANMEEAVFTEKPQAEYPVMVLIDRFGYARAMDPAVYEKKKEELLAESRFVFSSLSTGKICLFTDTGLLHVLKVADLPQSRPKEKGVPVDNISRYDSKTERLVAAVDMDQCRLSELLFITQKGQAKRVDGSEFVVSKRSTQATRLFEEDALLLVAPAEGAQLILKSRSGYFLRFSMEEIPKQKKTAGGVRAMRLSAEDTLTDAVQIQGSYGETVCIDKENYPVSAFKTARRDGKGSKKGK